MRKKLFFLLISCLPLSVFSADIIPIGDLNSAEAYYRQGKEFLNKGDYIHANEYFKKAEKLLGGHEYSVPMPTIEPPAHIASDLPVRQELVTEDVSAQPIADSRKAELAAREAFSAGEYERAVFLYGQLVEEYPKNTDLFYNLALSYIEMSDYAAAREIFEKILKIKANDLNTLYNLGVICESYLGEPEQAIVYYKRFLSCAGDAPDAKNVRNWVKYLEQQVH